MKLYEISGEIAEIADMIENGEKPEVWRDTLDALECEFDAKAENIAVLIKSLDAECDAIETECRALEARCKAKMNARNRLKDYLKAEMENAGKTKIDAPRAFISIKNNPESVAFSDEKGFIEWARENNDGLLNYKEPSISKTEVKRLLKSGVALPYAQLEKTRRLDIK